ncbi:putative addiction module antidote protein [Rhodoferax sp. 4810]|uniref:Putative addiction module antidote protein n=1 Tax=Thiospirillum jenense TaxID=1653858 RepID=A0A839HFZ6_9GAMM|nr:addiction module antidote protein [Thiospirillum jenense]MBB1075888.1 putative addiction module antidote protein [Rhodoferax jenense]MBB1126088.1 putative addiction module antidote protein [Thiospirillum jenense]
MNETIYAADLPEFDMADYLEDERAIAEYLTVVLEEHDPAALIQALGTIARVRGMTEIATVANAALEALHQTAS